MSKRPCVCGYSEVSSSFICCYRNPSDFLSFLPQCFFFSSDVACLVFLRLAHCIFTLMFIILFPFLLIFYCAQILLWAIYQYVLMLKCKLVVQQEVLCGCGLKSNLLSVPYCTTTQCINLNYMLSYHLLVKVIIGKSFSNFES